MKGIKIKEQQFTKDEVIEICKKLCDIYGIDYFEEIEDELFN